MEDLSQEPQEEEKVTKVMLVQKVQACGLSFAAFPHSTQSGEHLPKGIRLLWPTLEPPAITLLRS